MASSEECQKSRTPTRQKSGTPTRQAKSADPSMELQELKELISDLKFTGIFMRMAKLEDPSMELQELKEQISNLKLSLKGVGGQDVVEYTKPDTFFSSLYPVKVTILAAVWDSSHLSIFTMQLANQLARFSVKGLQVSVLIPENAYINKQGTSNAENCGVTCTIVKAKKQPGFPDPIDWLYFSPADLKTDVVIGIGSQLGKIAQYWKIQYQCKNIQIVERTLSDYIFMQVSDVCIEDVIKELFINADVPVAIGPKTTDDLSASLRSGGKQVLNLTPGIISELSNLTYGDTKDGPNFRVLLVGGDNPDNFLEEGLELAAKIMAELSNKSYSLICIGVAEGTEPQFMDFFHKCGVSTTQLMIRNLPKTEDEWKKLFCEADLAIMPSGDEEFGWGVLLALSAGLPVLVHGESGFGEALRDVTLSKSAIVDSDDAKEWASRIKTIRETARKTRLEHAALLRSNYDEKYSWEKQCEALAAMIFTKVSGLAHFSGLYSPSNPVKVTILAAMWDSHFSAICSAQLAKQFAKVLIKGIQVSVFVPGNTHIDQWGMSDAESCGVTIVKAKKQPGLLNYIDWMFFSPADLETDVVIGIGARLGKVAQYWKIQYQCKNIQIAGHKLSNISLQVSDECNEDVIKELCINADVPLAIGHKMTDYLSASLRPKGKQVLNLTPGIISEFRNLTHAINDRRNFRVLLVDEELELAAETIAELNDKSYHLIYVGARKETVKQFADLFHQCGVPKRQLTIRSLPKTEQEWKDLFCEVDLAILPSGNKTFALDALFALSAGLPLLVHGESGFGEALRDVTLSKSAVVDSYDAKEWASRIKTIRETARKTRLEQAAMLRSNYDEKYSWVKQLGPLVEMMFGMVSGWVHFEAKPLSKTSLYNPFVLEENKVSEIEPEGDIEVVSALGSVVETQGVTTRVPAENICEDFHGQVFELGGEEGIGEGSHDGSDEEVEEEHGDETETETEGDAVEGEIVMEVVSGGAVTSEVTHLSFKDGAVHLMFPPDAVSTSIVLHRWKYRSPPLQEHEAISSNVIELSPMDGQGLKFNTKLKLSLSHSATNLLGYELVIKKLVDKEMNDWKEVDGTRDVRCLEEIEHDFPSHMEIPDYFFPFAQADIAECSTYAVVCRLKASPTYIISSSGGSFSHPDFPGVTVTIPENAVAPYVKFPLLLKVQEVPSDEFQEAGFFLGPILRINCFETVQFSRSVTIQLPLSLREEQVLLPAPTTCRVRVMFLKSDDQDKEWIEVTDDLAEPASFDGKFVRFQVERFSGYWPFFDWRKNTSNGDEQGIKRFLYSLIWNQPRPTLFVAYFQPGCLSILYLICCPAHLKKQVIQDLKQEGIIPCHGSSKKDMIPGHDKAFVYVSGAIYPFEVKEMEDFYLKLYEDNLPFEAHLKVRLINDQQTAQVEFRNTFQPTGRNLSLCTLHLPIPTQYTYSLDFEERSQLPRAFAGDVKKGIPTDEELEDLSEKIPDHWKKLGRRLTFDKAELEAFDKDNDKIADKAYAMLMAWKEREGSAATYRVLNKALCDIRVKRRDLAQQFCL